MNMIDFAQFAPWCFLVAAGAMLLARDRFVRFAGLFVFLGSTALLLKKVSKGSLANVTFVVLGLVGAATIGYYLLGKAKAPTPTETPFREDDLGVAEPTVCLRCHTAIPTGVDHCPKCGWTYRDA